MQSIDTEPGMRSGIPESTICVQDPVDSRNSAIHNAYRTSLRPSSLIEPRHPSLKVVKASVKHTRYNSAERRESRTVVGARRNTSTATCTCYP